MWFGRSAGRKWDAAGLMGPGVDPHLYKASQGDVKKLDEAEIIFYGGLHLEGKMTEISRSWSKRSGRSPFLKISTLRCLDRARMRGARNTIRISGSTSSTG
ncbi:hypothetical protein HMSSN036_49330 [Paenibacillus macerans]|nr:hypothetical protein HMSSN036_49330 [Paenibacillus macerans]